MRARYSIKQLLWWTLFVAALCVLIVGPRRYAATASANFGSFPKISAVHPRFVQYEQSHASNEEVARHESERILSGAVIDDAVRQLAEQGVTVAQLGGDAGAWYRAHVTLSQLHDGLIQIRLKHWQSAHAGRDNFGRNTVAWKALVALLSAYQADALGEGAESSTGNGEIKPENCRIPWLNFSYVESGLW